MGKLKHAASRASGHSPDDSNALLEGGTLSTDAEVVQGVLRSSAQHGASFKGETESTPRANTRRGCLAALFTLVAGAQGALAPNPNASAAGAREMR